MVVLVVMGVCGSGKTTIGRALASKLGCRFTDADDWHPEQNIAKMKGGVPLNDQDRFPWLMRLHDVLLEWESNNNEEEDREGQENRGDQEDQEDQKNQYQGDQENQNQDNQEDQDQGDQEDQGDQKCRIGSGWNRVKGVMACSALKKIYRDVLSETSHPPEHFRCVYVVLDGKMEVIRERMKGRGEHLMPLQLLQSQFDSLELPSEEEGREAVFIHDITLPVETIVTNMVQEIGKLKL